MYSVGGSVSVISHFRYLIHQYYDTVLERFSEQKHHGTLLVILSNSQVHHKNRLYHTLCKVR